MSDTSPDQKEAEDAPAGPRNPWVSWLVWAILAPVVYVLSIGPAVWLMRMGYLPELFGRIYYPLGYLPADTQNLISRYMDWWAP